MEDNNPEQIDPKMQEALQKWMQEQYQNCGQYAQRLSLISANADGRPHWAIPGQIFLCELFDKGAADKTFWVISGVIPTDHIEGHLAADPRAAARHFVLKWQLQSARIAEPMEEDNQNRSTDWADVGGRLAESAEKLTEFTEDDQYWRHLNRE